MLGLKMAPLPSTETCTRDETAELSIREQVDIGFDGERLAAARAVSTFKLRRSEATMVRRQIGTLSGNINDPGEKGSDRHRGFTIYQNTDARRHEDSTGSGGNSRTERVG